MGIRHIEKFSYRFYLLKFFVKIWHDTIFYRKVTYINRQQVPLKEHLIFTPNHQNALMDALAIEFSFRNQFVFVARSDIFKKKWIASLLYFLKILPVYRIRDGYESLKKNEEIFRKTLDVIRNKNGFVIMPEGDHAGFRRLRRLRKGFARIAFQAEEATDYTLDMKIVPVGITYSHYERYRSELLVVYGEPIPLSDYYEDYRQNPAQALNKLTGHLSEKMRALMIEIKSVDHYAVYWCLSKLYKKRVCEILDLDSGSLYDTFKAQKQVVAVLEDFELSHPGEFSTLALKTGLFLNRIKDMKLDPGLLQKKQVSGVALAGRLLFLIVTAPLFLYGFLNNFLPYYLPMMAAKKVRDPQFRSSFKFVLSLFLFPIFYLIQVLAAGSFIGWNGILLIYIASLPLSGAFSWNAAKVFKQTRQVYRWLRYRNSGNLDFAEVLALHSFIDQKMEQLLNGKMGKVSPDL